MAKPKAPRALVVKTATEDWERRYPGVVMPHRYLFAVRSYYQDSMGVKGRNDVGQFDDACFWVTPTDMVPVNWNTDPSKLGWNPGVGKPYAMLLPGVWWFRRGPHKGVTPALRQFTDEEGDKIGLEDTEFEVLRAWGLNDKRNYTETGYFAINIHPGGEYNTSSWGCQTAPKSQAKTFLQRVWDDSFDAHMNKIAYILHDGPII